MLKKGKGKESCHGSAFGNHVFRLHPNCKYASHNKVVVVVVVVVVDDDENSFYPT